MAYTCIIYRPSRLFQNFGVDIKHYWLWVLAMFIVPLLVTIMISLVSYRLLEKAFLQVKDRSAIIYCQPVWNSDSQSLFNQIKA